MFACHTTEDYTIQMYACGYTATHGVITYSDGYFQCSFLFQYLCELTFVIHLTQGAVTKFQTIKGSHIISTSSKMNR